MNVDWLRNVGQVYKVGLTTECGINCTFCTKTVLVGILEKNNFPTRQLQSQVTVRELTSIETRQKVGLAIGWIDIQGFARPVI